MKKAITIIILILSLNTYTQENKPDFKIYGEKIVQVEFDDKYENIYQYPYKDTFLTYEYLGEEYNVKRTTKGKYFFFKPTHFGTKFVRSYFNVQNSK